MKVVIFAQDLVLCIHKFFVYIQAAECIKCTLFKIVVNVLNAICDIYFTNVESQQNFQYQDKLLKHWLDQPLQFI